MRTLIAILFLCCTASAQSFVISGGQRSMIVSGSGPVVQQAVKTEVETKTRITPRKVVTKTETSVETVTQPAFRQWYLVSEEWCRACPPKKKAFLAKGWPRKNIITLAQCQAMFGFQPSGIPYEFPDPKWVEIKTETVIQPQVKPGFYDPTIYDGQPGSSHQNRQSLINHLIREHAQNSAQLNGLSDSALNDLHNQMHATPRVTETIIPRYLNIEPYGTIDLATYSRTDRRGNPCQCGMCQAIYPHQRAYREQQARLKASHVAGLDIGQQATPMELVASGVKEMGLSAEDFFGDIGCGDGRWLIEAVQASGCQAVGVEYDHDLCEVARERVRSAGLSDKIEIIEGDARTFDYSALTAIAVHLYDDLLTELASQGAFDSARVVVAPYHEVPGLQMAQRGGVFVADRRSL